MVDDGSGRHGGRGTAGCSSCLPFCFWGSRVPAEPAERRRRRRRRCRLRLRLRLSLSWLLWPWLRKRSGGKDPEASGGSKNKGKSRRKMLLLLLRSLQAKKDLAAVSSGTSFLAKQVSSFGNAMKRNRNKLRQTVDADAPPITSCGKETAPARPGTIIQPSLRPADGIWRAPSSRFQSLQLGHGGAEHSAVHLWTAATTLSVIVFLGRVTAMFFLCSCMYGARWWFGAARTETRSGTPDGGGSRRRLGDRVALDYLLTEEQKKKMVMYGLLDRTSGKRPSSRFCI